jgi:hypothetical protein
MSSIFDDVRARVRMTDAIAFLGIEPTKREGDQLRFACPACKGSDKRALSINVETDKFRCFSWDKGGTDATALVAHVKGCSQSEAAKMLKEHFLSDTKPSTSPKPRRESVADEERSEPSSDALRPLDYLEVSHPVIEMLGLTEAACEALGAGYAKKGTMAGRICIPLRLPDGTLTGYLGIATKPDMSPLLLFPKNLEERCKPEEKPQPDELRKLFRVVGE